MTGLLRKATLLTACGVLFAVSAMAGVPSPANSDAPGCINVVGSSAGVPDTTYGKFCVTVRDLASNLLNGSSVVVDFINTLDIKTCNDHLNPNYVVTCGSATVRAFTDVTGVVCFTILGGSVGPASSESGVSGGAGIYADGVLLATVGVGAYDLDGSSGVGANDLAIWLDDFAVGVPVAARSDYDCSGDVGANDLALWLDVFAAGGSAESCVGICTP